MWFILLFAVCALAIPISLEIHVKGSDNIIARSRNELLCSPVGKRLSQLSGLTREWIYSLFASGASVAVAVKKWIYSSFIAVIIVRVLLWILPLAIGMLAWILQFIFSR